MNPDAQVDAPLSEAGERAARELGQTLACEPIAVVVTSPRLRARRTAELLLAGRDVPVLELDELAEIDAGSFAGGPVSAFRQWMQSSPLAVAPPEFASSTSKARSRAMTGPSKPTLSQANVFSSCSGSAGLPLEAL